MTRSNRSQRAASLLVLCLCWAGCSTYDPDHLDKGLEFTALTDWVGKTGTHRILVAPIEAPDLSVSTEEEETRSSPMACDTSAFQRELLQALRRIVGEGTGTVALAEAKDRDGAAQEAWEGNYDLLLTTRVRRWDAAFLDTNVWWYPNALFLGWYFWPIGPQWWIGDEVYGVGCEVEVDVLSVASEKALPALERRAVVVQSRPPGEEERPGELDVVPAPQLALDDLDRGLDLFGTWAVGKLDLNQWEQVGGILEPYARRHTAVRVAAAVADGVARFDAPGEAAERERERVRAATHALVVGIRDYPQPCPAADRDAELFHELLLGELPRLSPPGVAETVGIDSAVAARWAPTKNAVKLVNGQATRGAIAEALRGIGRRSAPEDTVVIYFAGRGGRAEAPGLASFVLETFKADASTPEGAGLSLAELASLLKEIPASRRLVVLDVDFRGGGPRGQGDGPDDEDPQELSSLLEAGFLAGLAERSGVILASGQGPSEVVQTYEEQGLLTQYLVRALSGEADEGGDGLGYTDLREFLERHVVNLSEVALNHPQRPLVVSGPRGTHDTVR